LRKVLQEECAQYAKAIQEGDLLESQMGCRTLGSGGFDGGCISRAKPRQDKKESERAIR